MSSSEVFHPLQALFNTDFLRKGLNIIGTLNPNMKIHVGSADSWPNHLVRGETAAMIFNTHYHNEPGEHWVGAYIDGSAQKCFIFDSMPLQDYPAIVLSKISSICNSVVNDNKDGFVLQHPSFPLCGLYCLAFLERRTNHLPPLELDPLARMQNDVKVLDFMLPYLILILR